MEVLVERFVEGYEDIYSVDVHGNIFSHHSGEKRLMKRVYNKSRNRWFVRLVKDYDGQVYDVHTLVAKTFLDNPNNYKHVIFKDGDINNLQLSNLDWKAGELETPPDGCSWVDGFEGLYYKDVNNEVYNKSGYKMTKVNGKHYTLYKQGYYYHVVI